MASTLKEAPDIVTKGSGDATSTSRRKGSEQPKQKPRGLAEGIRTLRGAASLCDVLLVVGDEAFPAHQAMLSAMSPAFGVYLREALPEPQHSADAGESASLGPLVRVVQPAAASTSEVAAAAAAPALPTEATSIAGSYESIARAALMQEESCADDKAAVASSAADAVTVSGDAAANDDQSNEKQVVPAEPEQHLKLRVRGVSLAESVKIMLDYIYQVGTGCTWEYRPSSLEVNKEVLRLARQFELKHLHEHAARWLTRGLTTKNLVERLVICEEFKLGMLREKLIEQLTANPAELSFICRSTEVLAHPTILQDLLVQVSTLCGMQAAGAQQQGQPLQTSSPSKREAPEAVAEETASEKIVEDDRSEKASDKALEKEKGVEKEKFEKAPEKAAAKADDKENRKAEKNAEDKKAEKGKAESKEPEKVAVSVKTTASKVPPLKKRRTGV